MLSTSYCSGAIIAVSLFAMLAQALPTNRGKYDIANVHSCNCTGTTNEGANGTGYICGDPRLGPIVIDDDQPLANLLYHYSRFGQLSPGEFLTKWWNASASNGNGSWIWPDQDGYLLDSNNTAIKGSAILKKGTLIDRFGSENGVYVSVADSPYAQRSIPPQSLNNGSDPQRYPSDYHLYRVMKDLKVQSGPIAPWFEQPGLGAQFFLGPPLVNHTWQLVEDGRLERVNSHEADLIFAKKDNCK